MVLPILATQRCRGGRYTEQVNKTDPNLLGFEEILHNPAILEQRRLWLFS